jgi:hypothetical protein
MKHLLKTSLSIVLALAAASQVYAIERKAALGGFDGFVERMGAGTREMGRGNTGSADTASMPGAYWNPAILGFRENTNYTLNADKRDLDRMGGNAGIEIGTVIEWQLHALVTLYDGTLISIYIIVSLGL